MSGVDAREALDDLLIDPITGISQAARTVLARHESMSADLRQEVIGLLYDRACELQEAVMMFRPGREPLLRST